MKRISLIFSVFFVLVALVLFPLMSACAKPAAPAQTLKIGIITSITGQLAVGLKAIGDAAKPTQDLLNQKGGITVNGQKYNIEIVAEDDQSSPDGAVAAAQKLMGDGIKFIISPIFPPNGIAISPICEAAKVIRVCPSQLDPVQFGADRRYNFDAWQTTYSIIPVFDYLLKNYPQVKKVALVSPDDPGMDFSFNYTTKYVATLGLQLVSQERYAASTQDFNPILTKTLDQKPDAIDCIGGLAMWAAGIVNSARELGFTGPIYSTSPFGDINLINSMIKPGYANDIFDGVPDVLSDKMLPIVKELRPLVEQAKPPFIFDSVNVLSALMPILQGIEKAQSFDTDKVVAAMESMKSVDTPYGPATWSGEDLGGINHMIKMENLPLSRIMNGKIEFEFVKG